MFEQAAQRSRVASILGGFQDSAVWIPDPSKSVCRLSAPAVGVVAGWTLLCLLQLLWWGLCSGGRQHGKLFHTHGFSLCVYCSGMNVTDERRGNSMPGKCLSPNFVIIVLRNFSIGILWVPVPWQWIQLTRGYCTLCLSLGGVGSTWSVCSNLFCLSANYSISAFLYCLALCLFFFPDFWVRKSGTYWNYLLLWECWTRLKWGPRNSPQLNDNIKVIVHQVVIIIYGAKCPLAI